MATEIDKLDPIPDQVTLHSGMVVQLESLKARQFFKLLRIITHGALPGMRDAGLFNMDGLDSEEFVGRLLSVTLLSIPDAEDEAIAFIRSLCYPYGLVERKGLNKQDVERNQVLWDALDEELENPELDDLVTILEAVVKRESEDIQALGKRLASLFKLAEKTGQIDPKSEPSPVPSESTSTSSAGSAARSTSSRRSTGGKTTSSSTSPLDDYVSASPPSVSDSTTPAGSTSNG